MVKSKINDNIVYHEYSHLEKEDFNYRTPLYNLKIMGITVIVGVGQLNYRYSKRYGVVYVPIYLFNQYDEFIKQIGVYEMTTNEVKMDDSGDVEINKLTPLLYGTFVNTTLLRQSLVSREKPTAVGVTNTKPNVSKNNETKVVVDEIKKSLGTESVNVESDSDSDGDADMMMYDTSNAINKRNIYGMDARQSHLLSGASILPLQTKDQSELERKQYKFNAKDLWIQKFLRNKYFNFIDNEGGSDSLFAVIRDALLTQGRATTILEIRKQLSEEVTDEVFKSYREKYALYHGISKTQNSESKNMIEQYNDYKRRISSIHDRAQQQLMIAGAKKIALEHNMKISEIKYTKLLSSQYDYMKEVRNTEQLKERMQTSLYWPDNWAIATLERILNMKFIFFSSSSYDAGDIENVLQCGGVDMIDPLILRKSSFEPTAYIIIDKGLITPIVSAGAGAGAGAGAAAGSSSRSRSPGRSIGINASTNKFMYRLITYKTHGVFSFSEVPYDIKLLITTKCLETQSGSFCLIPQFKLFQKELGIRVDENNLSHQSIDDILEEVHMDSHGNGTSSRSGSHLYSPDIVFQFYNKSNPNALPGMGCGEKIPEEDKIHFQKLASYDNWRRKLSNFWTEPFMLDNRMWLSVEHYYQGSKFKNNNREFYLKFSLDSRSELSSDPTLAKVAGSKTGKINGAIIRPSNISVDPDFFSHGRGEREMESAIYAKFSQNKGLKDMLMATRNAKLVLYLRGTPPKVFHNLMRVRHKLRTNTK
jgi:predicted NAD-dependent protein-ADP-ribosyltransferase YbiA (DUF1768 family)